MRLIKIASVLGTVCVTIVFLFVLCSQLFEEETVAPQIEMDSTSIAVSVLDGEAAYLSGVTAYDAEDGDLTDMLMIETISNFITDTQREVSIVVFDTDGNFTTTTRTITYTDYTATTFSLTSPLRFAQGTSSSSFSKGLSASDCLDGNITSTITQYTEDGSTIDTEVTGNYSVTFSVSNSAGAVEKFTATVEIYDVSTEAVAPQINISESLIYLSPVQAAVFDPLDYITGVTYESTYYQMTQDGQLLTTNAIETLAEFAAISPSDEDYEAVAEKAAEIEVLDLDKIKITNPVSASQTGWCEVVYRLTDSSNNTKTMRLIVCVTE